MSSFNSSRLGTLLIVLNVSIRATFDTKITLTLSWNVLPNKMSSVSSKQVLSTTLKLQYPKYTTTKLMYFPLQSFRDVKMGEFQCWPFQQALSICFIFYGIFPTIQRSALIFTSTSNISFSEQTGSNAKLFEYLTSRRLFSSPSAKEGLLVIRQSLSLRTISLREILWVTSNRLSTSVFQALGGRLEHPSFYQYGQIFPDRTSESRFLKKVSRKRFSMTVLAFTPLDLVLHQF